MFNYMFPLICGTERDRGNPDEGLLFIEKSQKILRYYT